ncbi:TPA: hypothetical protein UL576_005042 [Klebsiella pneumoniae]|uniref:hypothetical protein n=1 Tax=Enterobacteriaceae TaxID=543 RepID=UPI000DE366B4|nr:MULTISPECIES: hypothetical protein [Enterobacteriaceae]HAU4452901.1 hypothetical protein [Citrobacter freundii]HDS6013038.1 hypothetical protein [Klebsiella variicola]EIX9725695.1 hypothetical protein [Klebsiella pneumoniae]HAU4515373.1 hypothetical protein [Citrobacter freundii]HAU4771441.1 hypothetical protein [Citrobacter freundii]
MSNIAYGKLAEENGFKLPVSVCKSHRGYYIGTFQYDPDSEYYGPVSRESEEYYKTEEMAQGALNDNNWTQRLYF